MKLRYSVVNVDVNAIEGYDKWDWSYYEAIRHSQGVMSTDNPLDLLKALVEAINDETIFSDNTNYWYFVLDNDNKTILKLN